MKSIPARGCARTGQTNPNRNPEVPTPNRCLWIGCWQIQSPNDRGDRPLASIIHSPTVAEHISWLGETAVGRARDNRLPPGGPNGFFLRGRQFHTNRANRTDALVRDTLTDFLEMQANGKPNLGCFRKARFPLPAKAAPVQRPAPRTSSSCGLDGRTMSLAGSKPRDVTCLRTV